MASTLDLPSGFQGDQMGVDGRAGLPGAKGEFGDTGADSAGGVQLDQQSPDRIGTAWG